MVSVRKSLAAAKETKLGLKISDFQASPPAVLQPAAMTIKPRYKANNTALLFIFGYPRSFYNIIIQSAPIFVKYISVTIKHFCSCANFSAGAFSLCIVSAYIFGCLLDIKMPLSLASTSVYLYYTSLADKRGIFKKGSFIFIHHRQHCRQAQSRQIS